MPWTDRNRPCTRDAGYQHTFGCGYRPRQGKNGFLDVRYPES
jgi:hypothetical protein